MVSVSDEVKAELAEVVKQDFIAASEWGKADGSKKPDVINKYLNAIPSEQRNSAAWTLQRMAADGIGIKEMITGEFKRLSAKAHKTGFFYSDNPDSGRIGKTEK